MGILDLEHLQFRFIGRLLLETKPNAGKLQPDANTRDVRVEKGRKNSSSVPNVSLGDCITPGKNLHQHFCYVLYHAERMLE